MPKTKISEFSATPANNTDIDSINIAEGCAPSGINDAIRELMSQLKDFQTGAVGDSFNGPIGTSTAAAGAFTTLAASGAVTLSGGTANGVTYLNGSKVLTSGSAIQFDGSNLLLGTTTSNGRLTIKNPSVTGLQTLIGIQNGSGTGTIGSLTFNQDTDAFSVTNNTSGGSLVFSTNATEVGRFTNAGNFGIGTSSPTEKLTVAGNIKLGTSGTSFIYGPATTGRSIYANSDLTAYIIAYGSSYGGSNDAGLQFTAGTSNSMIFNASGNLGLGLTPSAWSLGKAIEVNYVGNAVWSAGVRDIRLVNNVYYASSNYKYASTGTASMLLMPDDGSLTFLNATSGSTGGTIAFSTRVKIDDAGNLLVGKTSTSDAAGATLYANGTGYFVRSSGNVLEVNRLTTDGTLILFAQDSTNEGSISVSGTTVSYNGGHLSRWAQTTAPKDDSIVKGTVLSNLDEMNVYTKDGQPVANEQLNKVKVSDTEGDINVAGVFVNWSHDEDHDVDEINMAMTGDMIIRIAQGTTVVRGDLLMSAGDGTAKPQGDDIVRSKTVAKVTSNHITCTYADGSYCVPCVLMAC